jgi:hypothetical protein
MSNNNKLWISSNLTILGIIVLTAMSIRNDFRHGIDIKQLKETNQTIDSLTNEIIQRDTIIIDSLRNELQSKEYIIGSYQYMWSMLSITYPNIAKKIEKEVE